MSYGVAMIPKEVEHPKPGPSDKSEETQPKDTLNEDSDRIRDEVFKRMFPDRPKKSPQ